MNADMIKNGTDPVIFKQQDSIQVAFGSIDAVLKHLYRLFASAFIGVK
jgi:hypothetical protein